MSEQEEESGFRSALATVVQWPVMIFFRILNAPMALVQRGVGIKGIPWIFLLPNLAFFSMFVIIPLFMNFAYSMTGGTELYLQNRPYVGVNNTDTYLNASALVLLPLAAKTSFGKGFIILDFLFCFRLRFLLFSHSLPL